MSGLIYLASPYSHPDPLVRERRFNAACHAAAHFMAQGHLIFSPIAHTHPICLAGALPSGFDYWEKYDRAILAVCKEFWILRIDGWEQSKGITAERRIAHELGIPWKYV